MAGGDHSSSHSSGAYHPGEMDISHHKATFSGFLKVAEWGTILTVASVGLLSFAFAMGLGWWTGLIVYAVICGGAGLVMKMGPAWWATTAVTVFLLGVGGAVTMGLIALGG
jgi:hypothetical protein